VFWETTSYISPESTLIQPQKTTCLKSIVRWSASSLWKQTCLKLFIFFILLDPRSGLLVYWDCKYSLFCLLSCQKSLHDKNQQMCSLWIAWNNLGLQNIYLCFMGLEEYSIGCWFQCLVLSQLFVNNCCFQSVRLCLSVSVFVKPFQIIVNKVGQKLSVKSVRSP